MISLKSDIEMQVVARDKTVHLLFSRTENDSGDRIPAMTDNMLLDPETALLCAQVMTDLAFEADQSIKPVNESLKASLVERHRAKLIPRITTVLNSQRERKKLTNHQLAIQMLDIVCAEVFS